MVQEQNPSSLRPAKSSQRSARVRKAPIAPGASTTAPSFSLPELIQLIEVAKNAGLTEFSGNGVTLKFGGVGQPQSEPRVDTHPIVGQPQALSDEDMLFWSTDTYEGPPPPKPQQPE